MMTAEEIQSHVQALAPAGVKVILSKNSAEITLQSDADWTATSFEPKYLEVIDPVVIAQALGFDVQVKPLVAKVMDDTVFMDGIRESMESEKPDKPKRTKQPSK